MMIPLHKAFGIKKLSIRCGQPVPSCVLLRFHSYTKEPFVISMAEIAARSSNRRGDKRTLDQRIAHFINGFALELAVAEWLESIGFLVEPAPNGEKWFDFYVNGIKVDIKGIFSKGVYFYQSSWEHDELKNRPDEEVVYLCFKIYDTKIVFFGAVKGKFSREKIDKTGPDDSYYFPSDKLEDFHG